MEEERKKLTDQLYQAQKMEAIGTLAGGIAHDFNNLLMGIQGYTSIMLMEVDASHPYYEQLKAIQTMVQSGAGLTKQLLGFARSGRYEVKPTDLNDLIGRSVNLFGRTRKEIRIFEKYADNVLNVEVDRGQIEQVLLNLFVNAWQAMPGGGSLYLETENVVFDKSSADLYDLKAGHYVKVSVTDTGVGMDEKTRQRIFDPFFTTKGMGRGTGLGLASAYGIIKGHGGMITVYSEKGQGTTFHIYLPASKKKAAAEEAVETELSGGRETILLVDDEEVITEVTSRLLGELGYTILTAGSGEQAVEIYRQRHTGIQLVILDMIMPGMSGGETFDELRAINPSVRVILSSGYSIDGKAQAIMKKGLRIFLQKPYRLHDLAKKIREALSD
jgi:nitrogen-specific signal transduction histidine kinase/CheY-like chemotaxis protein